MKKLLTILILSCLAVASCLAACGASGEYKINAPSETEQAFCGEYSAPLFEVINEKGEFMCEFSVRLKEVKAPDGAAVEIGKDGRTVNAEKEGVHEFIYTADSKKVEDAVYKVSFKKKPPEVVFDSETLPDYYFKGLTYEVPECTFGTDADLEKSGVKVYYSASEGEEREEVASSGESFIPQYDSGNYIVVIRSEGSFGNVKEYEYSVPAQVGPSAVVSDKIAYFDEEFGVYQFKPILSEVAYSEDISYGDEEGSLEVTVKYGNDVKIGELKNLLTKDVSDYDALIVRVYNPNDFAVSVLYHEWFGLTDIPAKQWGALEISTSQIIGENGSQVITSLEDITSLSLLAFHDYKPLAAGTKLYFSAMYAFGYPPAPAPVPDKIAYFDNEYGVYQVKPSGVAMNYVTDKAYGDEEGSLKVTLNAPMANMFGTLKNISLCDVSSYDYIVFRVYSTSNLTLNIGVGSWSAAEWCTKDRWTEVKIGIDKLEEKYKTDLNNLNLYSGAVEPWGDLPAGTVFYISAMYGGNNPVGPQPPEHVAGKISNFDHAYGVEQVDLTGVTATFDENTKYGSEAGSLKFTTSTAHDGQFATLKNLSERDVSGYAYIVFRVYNAGSQTLRIGVGGWRANDEWCGSNRWTEIKISVSTLEAAKQSNLNGLILYAQAVNPSGSLAANTEFCISAIYGVNE